MGFTLEQHRSIRMCGYDLRKDACAVLQIRPFRKKGHAPRVLPWYCLLNARSR